MENELNLSLILASEKGADVHARDDMALQWASMMGHLKIVKLLLNHVATVDYFALRWASEKGHYNVVKLLKSYDKQRNITY